MPVITTRKADKSVLTRSNVRVLFVFHFPGERCKPASILGELNLLVFSVVQVGTRRGGEAADIRVSLKCPCFVSDL